jgi:predicted DsbA family dithiol-disulfide isomerase
MDLARLLGPRAADAPRRMAQFAAGFGITDMKHPMRIPNTRRALAVAELARAQGKLDAFRSSAMSAHWREGMNIEADADLRVAAERAGLDGAEAVKAADDPRYLARIDEVRAEANALGVTGIPTFVFGELQKNALAVVGCQPYDVLAAAIQRLQGTA